MEKICWNCKHYREEISFDDTQIASSCSRCAFSQVKPSSSCILFEVNPHG